MSEFKGTPGPWVASNFDRSIGPIIKDDDQSNGMILPVAWVEFDDKPGHHQSNANLIAAAPDLLNMLQATTLYIEKNANDGSGIIRAVLDASNAAIAKALGQ